MLTCRGAGDGRDQRADWSGRHAGTGLAQICEVVQWTGQTPLGDQEGNGRARNRSRAELNWFCQGPSLGEIQSEATGLAGDASGQGEEASSEGLGGCHRFAQTDARCPASQVVGDDLDSQPGAVGGKAARWQVVETHPVLEVADGVLDLGVATVIGLEIQRLAVPGR